MAVRTTRKAVSDESYEETESAHDEQSVRMSKRVAAGPISAGWGAPAAERRETEKAPYLKVSTTKIIIKLLDPEPAVRYKSHYVNNLRKYFTCIAVFNTKGDPDNVDCPLCEAGSKAGYKFMMNVIELDPDATSYEVKTWTFGPEVSDQLREFSTEKPTSPLNKTDLYFQVYQVKTDTGRTSNKVVPIRGAYLADDYGIEPFSEEELASFDKRYGESTVWITSTEKMIEAARSV